jgi:hypothetical protein
MDEEDIVVELAIKMHDAADCDTPFFAHTQESQEAWKRVARNAIKFCIQNYDRLIRKTSGSGMST